MRRYFWLSALISGAGLAGAAIFANRLGLDRNPEWGARRILLLLAGVLLIVLAIALGPGQRLVTAVRYTRAMRWLWNHRLGLLVTISVLSALVVYIFFLSAGKWTKWPERTRYYDDLGGSFRAGRLDLGIQPSPQLLVLPDPYDPSVRDSNPSVSAFVATVWDLTFFNGKFYLYWGPAPGLLLAVTKVFYSGAIPDQYLAFAFLTGLLIFGTLLILRLRRRFYQDAPVALTVIGILVAALAFPIPWMMNRAEIYEASIAAGQCFLIGGVYFAFRGLDDRTPLLPDLVVASVLWTLAVASRLVMLFPAAFMVGSMLLWVIRKSQASLRTWQTIGTLCILGLPFLAGLIGLGFYNWMRFGSVFETGLRYQLTSRNLNGSHAQLFQPSYVVSNLRLYAVYPIFLRARFPFVASRPMSLAAKSLYQVESAAGLLYIAPFALFSVLSLARVKRAAQALGSNFDGADDSALAWLILSLIGGSLLSIGALSTYFYVANRFLADVIPSLLLVSILGMWQGYHWLRNKPVARTAYVSLVVLVALATITVSLLLAFSEDRSTLLRFNRPLMEGLIRFFGG